LIKLACLHSEVSSEWLSVSCFPNIMQSVTILVSYSFHSKMSFKLQLHLPTHVLQTQTNNRFYAQHYLLSSNHSSPCSFSTTLSSHTTNPYCFPPSSSITVMTTDEPPVRMVAIVGHGAVSPLNSASWEQVMLHTVKYSISFLLSHFHVVFQLYDN